jgi:hypothetical protein
VARTLGGLDLIVLKACGRRGQALTTELRRPVDIKLYGQKVRGPRCLVDQRIPATKRGDRVSIYCGIRTAPRKSSGGHTFFAGIVAGTVQTMERSDKFTTSTDSGGALMAVALRLDFASLGLDDYDSICKTLNFPSDWPDGLIVHGSTEVDGRLRVVDMWESRQQFDRFVESRLQGAMGQAMGDRAEAPQITEMELHTIYTR